VKPATLLAALAVMALTVALSACGGSKSTETTTETTQSTSTTETTTTTEAVPTKTIAITYKDGKVVGGLAHQTVDKDTKVTLLVRSDVADEVHLHGYDKHVDVTPGTPAKLTFVASIPGRFVVELESRGLQISDLEVSP
jgi:major membrane immunogen (membrane-anchored lipoprotein)